MIRTSPECEGHAELLSKAEAPFFSCELGAAGSPEDEQEERNDKPKVRFALLVPCIFLGREKGAFGSFQLLF